jgi:hypothetical protein
MNQRTVDFILSIIVLALGLATLFYLIPTQVEVSARYDLASLSPAFFPELAAWLLVVLGGLLLISQLTAAGRARAGRGEAETDDETRQEFTSGDELRVWAVFLVSILYFYGLKYIGFIPATILGLAGLFLLQGVRGAGRLLVLSVVTAVLVYAFFHYVMNVHFPEALLFR